MVYTTGAMLTLRHLLRHFFKHCANGANWQKKAASDFGYACFICYSAVEAIDKIKGYYNMSI